MDLSRKLKELRQRDGLSQETLAERIYVTRQTISNWETERSYPDVQSLLLLSALFDVSLDELVKGDVEIMKNELDAYKMSVWTWVMLVATVIGGVSGIPLYMLFGYVGIIPSAILVVVGLVAAIVIERIKKKNRLQTYSEIVAFLKGEPRDASQITWSAKHKVLATILKLAGGAVAGAAVTLTGLLIAKALGG